MRTAPRIESVLRDPAWNTWSMAKPLTVTVREAMGGDHGRPVILRALHTDDSVFIAAEWEDATRSDMRDPYIWNAAQQRMTGLPNRMISSPLSSRSVETSPSAC